MSFSLFQVEHNMPSTRSQGRDQPTLQFPRRKSCRTPSRSKTAQLEKSPAPSPSKPANKPVTLLSPRRIAGQLTPLSPRKPVTHPYPLSPIRPTAQPSSPGLQARLPLSPRKRTGKRPTTM